MAQPLLSGEHVGGGDFADRRDETIARLTTQVKQLDDALRLERIRAQSLESGTKELKYVLTPLYRALQKVFGEFDAMQLSETEAQPTQGADKSAVWDMWKNKLGNQCARIIDALLSHGTMTRTQLCIATGIAGSNIARPISRLYTANLLNKNGNEYSLKKI